MKNIVLTEKQFELFLRNNLMESLSIPDGVEEGGNENVQRIIDYLKDTYKSDDDERREQRDNLKRLAGINKVNFDYSEDEFQRRKERLLQTKNEEIKKWVAKYLPILRKCWNGKTFKKSKEVARYSAEKGVYNTFTDYSNDKDAYDNLSDETKENVINLASFLDGNSLTCIYREFQKQPSVKRVCGLDLTDPTINYKTPIKRILSELDFTATIDKKDELLAFYDGTRVNSINKELGHDDKTRRIESGKGWEEVAEIAAYRLNEKRAKAYLKSTYGVELKFGPQNKMFKFGNNKVADDTLIINFASAVRCPAWNECIMKDACYAKSAEVMYDDSLHSNLKKNLIWEQTQIDEKLMSLMMALLRSYLLNYTELPVVKHLKRGVNKKEFVWELCQKTLYQIEDEYGSEAIDILSKTRRGNLIRLNENGDFIGQWLVDAFEQFARELEKVGINIAAYTCRALNYESVEKLILNISQQGLVRNQKSKAFAHFFYAIDPKDYARLGETYSGPNYSLEVVDGKIIPVYRKLIDNGELKGYYYKCPCGRGKYEYTDYVPKGSETKYKLSIVKNIQRDENTQCFVGNVEMKDHGLVDASKIRSHFVYDAATGTFYLKNGSSKSYRLLSDEDENFDFGTYLPTTIVTASAKIFVNVADGKIYRKVEAEKKIDVADCYMCRICYARDANGGVRYEGGVKEADVPVYVFVATHGANRNEFQDPQSRKIEGKTAGEWATILNNASPQDAVNESVFGEDTMEEGPKNDKLAIKAIVGNFADSIVNRMTGRTAKLNEIKTKFNSMLERING